MPQSDTPRVGFQRYDQGESWEYNEDFELLDETARVSLLDSGTFTLTGGNTPAANTTIQSLTATEATTLNVVVGVDTGLAQDYAFNYDVTHQWDNTAGEVDAEITVNWDTDPGAGNDVTVSYRVYAE